MSQLRNTSARLLGVRPYRLMSAKAILYNDPYKTCSLILKSPAFTQTLLPIRYCCTYISASLEPILIQKVQCITVPNELFQQYLVRNVPQYSFDIID